MFHPTERPVVVLGSALGALVLACGAPEKTTMRPRSDVEAQSEDTEGVETACIPNCKKRRCGDDGCGGSCGQCKAGEECKANGLCGLPCRTDGLEPDQVPEAAQSLSFDTPLTRALCPAGDVDWFAFTLNARTEVLIRSSGTDGGTFIALYDASGAEIEHDHEDDVGPFSTIHEELPAGQYRVLVRPASEGEEVREYTISLLRDCQPSCWGRQCGDDGCGGSCGDCPAGSVCYEAGFCGPPCEDPAEPDDAPEKARALEAGKAMHGALCLPGDQDWYTFGTGGRRALVRVECSSDVATEMWLFDAGLVKLAHDDSDEGVTRIEKSVAAGTKYLKVMADHEGDVVPKYAVAFFEYCLPDCDGRDCGEDGCGGTCGACGDYYACTAAGHCVSTCVDGAEPDDDWTRAVPIQPGAETSRSLCPEGDVDWYYFALSAPADVRVRASGVEGPVEIWLHDSKKKEIDYDGDDVFSDASEIHVETLPAGTYFIEVAAKDYHSQVPQYTVLVLVMAVGGW